MEDFQLDIEKCLEVLKAGGLILYPTDTVWGIGCDATNEDAVKKIYHLKQREDSKKLIVLMASEREVMQHVTQLDLSIFDYLETITKPTTVVYNGVIGLAENILGEDNNVAIRISKEPFCKNLIKRFQKPLVSTSANTSRNLTPSFFTDMEKHILDTVDYVVKYRQNDTIPAEPSAIVQWGRDGNIVIIRD